MRLNGVESTFGKDSPLGCAWVAISEKGPKLSRVGQRKCRKVSIFEGDSFIKTKSVKSL